MNPAEIEIEAGKVIETFAKYSNESGVIGVKDRQIVMVRRGPYNQNFHGVRTLTKWQIENGLTGPQWLVLAENLHELLILENKCPPHQKP